MQNYFGVKKIAGRHKLHSLGTTDRATAKRELEKWLADLEAGRERARSKT